MSEQRFPQRFLETIDAVVRSRDSDKEAVRAAAVVIAMTYGQVTVDDLRECVHMDGDQRWYGGVLRSLERLRVTEKFGYQKTRRRSSHGRDIVVYKLTQDWEQRWPADEINPKSKITFADGGDVIYVEERKVTH